MLPLLYSFRRCPFAMRARFALLASGTACELREVVLRDKPAALREASPKATVPVLVDVDGTVIAESLEIMQWALDAKRASAVDAAAVKCPILCLAGSRDRVNSPGTVRSIARRYRNHATFEELHGHSHWLIGEPGWEKIADHALGWLDNVFAAKAKS